MTNVFGGAPDARQSADVNHAVSRFRPTYRALTDDEKALHDALKAKAALGGAIDDLSLILPSHDDALVSYRAALASDEGVGS